MAQGAPTTGNEPAPVPARSKKPKRFKRKAIKDFFSQPPIGRYPLENVTESIGRPVSPLTYCQIVLCCATCVPTVRIIIMMLSFCCGYTWMITAMCGHEGLKGGIVVPMSPCRRACLAPLNWILRTIFCTFFGVFWIEEHYHDDSPYAIHCCYCCKQRASSIKSGAGGPDTDAESGMECDPMTDLVNTGRAGPPPDYGCGNLVWAFSARYLCCCFCPYLRSPDCPRVAVIGGHSSIFDILVIGSHFLPTIAMKEEVTRMPLIGPRIASLSPILVPRSAEEKKRLAPPAVQLVRRAHMALDDPHSHPPILVFPEGTTAGQRWLLEFQRGAFLPGVPVQPIMLQYPSSFFDSGWTPDTDTLWLTLRALTSTFNRVSLRYLKPSAPTEAQKRDPYRWGWEVRRQLAVAGCESDPSARTIPVPYSDHDSIMLNQFMRIGAGKYCLEHINAWKHDWGIGQLHDEQPWDRVDGYRVSAGLKPGEEIKELPSGLRKGMLIREGRKAAGLGVFQFTELALRFYDADSDKDGFIERGEFEEFLHPKHLQEHLAEHDPSAAEASARAAENKDRILGLFDLLHRWSKDTSRDAGARHLSGQSSSEEGATPKLAFRHCILGLGVVLSSYNALVRAQKKAREAAEQNKPASDGAASDAAGGGGGAAAAAPIGEISIPNSGAASLDITSPPSGNMAARAAAKQGVIADPATAVATVQVADEPDDRSKRSATTGSTNSIEPYDGKPPVAGRHMTDKDIGRLLRVPSNLEMGNAAIASTQDLQQRMLFAIFDEDGDGRLNKPEFKALLVAADRARMLQDGEEDELIEVVTSGGGAGTATPTSSPAHSPSRSSMQAVSPALKPTHMRRVASIRVEQEISEMLSELAIPQLQGSSEEVDLVAFKRLCEKKDIFDRLVLGAGWWFGSVLAVEL